MTTLYGRPYPVQFRNQGAIDAWTRALRNTEVWRRWQGPGTLCWQITQEVLQQLERVQSLSPVSGEMAQVLADDQRRLAVEISTNLKYHLNQGMVIETTAALETLLTNSDVDLSLPMSMVAPPYRAQSRTARPYTTCRRWAAGSRRQWCGGTRTWRRRTWRVTQP